MALHKTTQARIYDDTINLSTQKRLGENFTKKYQLPIHGDYNGDHNAARYIDNMERGGHWV